MSKLFLYLAVALVFVVLHSDTLTLVESIEDLLQQLIYIIILTTGVIYVGRCFRRACIDK